VKQLTGYGARPRPCKLFALYIGQALDCFATMQNDPFEFFISKKGAMNHVIGLADHANLTSIPRWHQPRILARFWRLPNVKRRG
jgi:hypothetical protein